MSLLNTLNLRSLRAQLTLWFGGLLLVTMTSVAIYIGHIASQEIMRTAGETLSISTRASAELLATNIGEREREVDLLRQAIEVDPIISGHRIRSMFERMQKSKPGYAWIGLTDADGFIREATGGLLVGQNVSNRPWFKGARNGPYMGDLHLAVLLAKLLPELHNDQPLRFIDIAVPLREPDGEVSGVLAAHLHWSWVTEIVNTIMNQDRLLDDAELLVVDRQGTILYPESYVAQLKVPANLDPEVPYSEVDWGDGQRYLTSIAQVTVSSSNDPGWIVIMRQPLASTLENIHDLQQQLFILGMLAFLAFVFIAHRIAGKLTRPIEGLVKVAKQIEKNPAQTRFPQQPGSPELSALSHALESMMQSLFRREQELARLNASLESQVASRTQELQRANQTLEQLAHTDPLTGLLNRRSFEKQLLEHERQSRLSNHPYCILMLDADHFKSVNDRFGHQVGDQVLQQLGQLIRQATRVTDVCARYGGEEFIVLIPEISSNSQGLELAEKIRTLVEQSEFPGVGHLTISIGLSESEPSDSNALAVIARADAALYQAKAQGRNRVVKNQSAAIAQADLAKQ